MDFAKQRRGSDKYIRAEDAFPGRYYTCPTCFAEVYLRRGRWRVAHFAHRAGTGKPDCEHFHPTDGLTYTWPGHGSSGGALPSYRPSDPLLLSIELQPETLIKANRLRGWELRVTIPKSEDTHGQITIDCGANVKRKVPLLKLSLGAQTYPVDLDTEDFGAIWASPEVKPEYRAVVEDRVRGLDRELPTLFASTTQRLKPRADRVTWGSSYYLIWHEAFELSQPRTLVAQPLATMDRWKCALITLPEEEDTEAREWLENATAVSISPHRRVFGLLFPAPLGFDILGRLIIPLADEFVVGFRQTDSDASSPVALRASAGGSSAEVEMEGSGRHLTRINLDGSRAHISINVNETTLPALLLTPLSADNVFPQVRFAVRDVQTGVKSPHALTSSDGISILGSVRRGGAEISELSSPSGVTGQLRWKRSTELGWNMHNLGKESESAVVLAQPSDIEQLNRIVKNRQFEIELDFGAFGIFKAFPQKHANEPAAWSIPRSLRQRVNWLLTASSVFVDECGVSIKRLPDEKVLSLVRSAKISPALAAQHRSITAELVRTRSEGDAR